MSVSDELRNEAATAWADVGAALGEAWQSLAGGTISSQPLDRILATDDPDQVTRFIKEAKDFASNLRKARFVGE